MGKSLNIAILLLLTIGLFSVSTKLTIAQEDQITFVLGRSGTGNFKDSDPVKFMDDTCGNVGNQWAESLMRYTCTSKEYIPALATGWTWSTDFMELTLTLRENVKFHDGTPYNASACKWNLDRLIHMMTSLPNDMLPFHVAIA